MANRLSVLILTLLLTGGAAEAATPWHQRLCLDNGGYWPSRVSVTVSNSTARPILGKQAAISLRALAGFQVESLRICRADGVELLYDPRDSSGAAKRTGALSADDTLLVPIECDANTSTALFVYAGNRGAWAVPDFLDKRTESADSDVTISIGNLEHLELSPPQPTRLRPRAETGNWAEVWVRNFSEQPRHPALIRVSLSPALARLPGLPLQTVARVTGNEGQECPSYFLGQGADLLFGAELAPRTEHLFQTAFSPAGKADAARALNDYARLLASTANLIPDASFENGNDVPSLWRRSPANNTQQMTFGFGNDARFGKRCLELNVSENADSAWVGWNSREIAVKPGATYFLAGWLKAVGLQSSATIHVHFHDAHGALTKSGAMTGTQPNVSGDSDWVNSRGFLETPPDAVTVQLHLTVNTRGILRHDGIVLCEVADGRVTGIHSAARAKSARELHVWQVNPLVKVFPDTPPQTQASALSAELGRNEFEPVELALRGPDGKAGRVDISVSPLKNKAGAVLPAVKIERVAYVPIDYPSAYYSTEVPEWCRKTARGSGATDGWAGWWPDPLVPVSTLDLTTNQTHPVWFTVHAPKDAAPGDYRAKVSLSMNGKQVASIPLKVSVLPFTLPERTHLRTIFDLRFGPGGAFGSSANSKEERRKWLRFIAEHRLGIDEIHPAPKFSYKEGQVTMDASEFDEEARFCFDELGMNVAYTPQFFYMFGWAYPPKKFFGLEPFTPEWTKAFKQAYQLFTDHIRQNGWHDRFVYYISDEPHFQNEFVVEQMKKLCALIHEVDPQLPIYSSTWRHCPAWDNSLDIWGVGQYGCFPTAEMERLTKAGKQMWFTCDGQMATDTPYLATERMLPYYCDKFGARGFEFWGFAWWTYNPWQTGWHQFIRQSDEGKKYYWIRYPNGDGFLAYPGKPIGIDGPVSTIRLEEVREGLEDYEAMMLLADLAEKAKKAGKSAAKAEHALNLARDLVTIPNAGGLRSTEILPDPDRIPTIRKSVNKALVELLR